MIKSLTKEQEVQALVFRDKWLKIALDTTPFDLEVARPLIDRLYKFLGKPNPLVVIMDGPIQSWIAVLVFATDRSQIRSQIYSQIRSQISSQIRNQIHSQIDSQIHHFVWPYLDGQFWAAYCAFYDYFFSNVVKCEVGDWPLLRDLNALSLIFPLDDVCVLCQKFSLVKMKNGLLHCDGGPSLQYPSGFSVWSLNGVRVPQWLAETKATEIEPESLFGITNAEVRREFVRKVGIERIIHKLGAQTLDKQDGPLYSGEIVPMYELLKFDRVSDAHQGRVGGDGYIYLSMVNPSLSTPDNLVYHVEGVGPNCNTVKDALLWRLNGNGNKYTFSENGHDWWIHGDVNIVKHRKTILKPRPIAVA